MKCNLSQVLSYTDGGMRMGGGGISLFNQFYHPLHSMFGFYKGLTLRKPSFEISQAT